MKPVRRKARSARNARWFAAYAAIMLAAAVLTLAASQYSIGVTVLAAAVIFGWIAWRSWRRSRRPLP